MLELKVVLEEIEQIQMHYQLRELMVQSLKFSFLKMSINQIIKVIMILRVQDQELYILA